MAVELLTVDHVTVEDNWEDHTTLYAHRTTGDYYVDLPSGRRGDYGIKGWRIGNSALVIYAEEVDGYIELLRKIKAQDDAPR